MIWVEARVVVDSVVAMGTTTSLPLRRVTFDYPERSLLCWTPRIPEVSAAANSVSLMMPFVEPYLARTLRRTLPDLPDDLADQTRWLIDQEIAHQRQHRTFNCQLVAEIPALTKVESMMRWVFRRLETNRPREFSVAFAAGSETVAYSIARWTEANASELFMDADPLATTLFMWHLAEEVEHKSVAFDVHQALGGSRFKYLLGAILSLLILGFFTVSSSLVMLNAQGRLRNPMSWWKLLRWGVSLSFEVLPNVFAAGLKSHHPSEMADPISLVSWLRLYDDESSTMPMWWVPTTAVA